MGRFRRQPKWSPLTGTPGGMARVRHGLAAVAVCGEQLDGALRRVLAESFGAALGEPESGKGVELVVVEELCSHPERLSSFYQKHRPAGLVVAACGLGAARAAADRAVADGADAARVIARSLSPALGRGAARRTLLVTASCRAWSRRARVLAGAPWAATCPGKPGSHSPGAASSARGEDDRRTELASTSGPASAPTAAGDASRTARSARSP